MRNENNNKNQGSKDMETNQMTTSELKMMYTALFNQLAIEDKSSRVGNNFQNVTGVRTCQKLMAQLKVELESKANHANIDAAIVA